MRSNTWLASPSAKTLISRSSTIIGGYGLPDKAMLRLGQSEEFWLKEFLETLSAETLTKVMKRARAAGTGKIDASIADFAEGNSLAQVLVEAVPGRASSL
jgi:hypothetical protein